MAKGVADNAVDGDIMAEPMALEDRKSEGEMAAPGDRPPAVFPAAPPPLPPPANAERKENTVFF